MQDIYFQIKDQILKEIYCGIKYVRKKYPHYMFLKIKDATKESLYSTKVKYILLTHFLDEHFLG